MLHNHTELNQTKVGKRPTQELRAWAHFDWEVLFR